jgi:hypothetical protein
LTGDFTPDMRALLAADIIISTPEKWDGISRNWHNRSYVTKVISLSYGHNSSQFCFKISELIFIALFHSLLCMLKPLPEMTHLSSNMLSASFVIPILSLGSLSTYPLVDTWPIR